MNTIETVTGFVPVGLHMGIREGRTARNALYKVAPEIEYCLWERSHA